MNINKELFCKLIDEIKKQVNRDFIFGCAIEEYLLSNVTFRANLDLLLAITAYLDNETGCCHYINTYVFETDFGRQEVARTEMAYELEGIDTSEKLYDFLVEKHKEKENK